MPTTAVRPAEAVRMAAARSSKARPAASASAVLPKMPPELHELGFRLLEAAELAVGLLIDDGRDAAQFGDLLDEAAAHEDDVGFARHEGLEVDFLGRAGVDALRVVLVLREPGKGRGLRQAVTRLPRPQASMVSRTA